MNGYDTFQLLFIANGFIAILAVAFLMYRLLTIRPESPTPATWRFNWSNGKAVYESLAHTQSSKPAEAFAEIMEEFKERWPDHEPVVTKFEIVEDPDVIILRYPKKDGRK